MFDGLYQLLAISFNVPRYVLTTEGSVFLNDLFNLMPYLRNRYGAASDEVSPDTQALRIKEKDVRLA